jgi:hypothetical protein
VPGTEYKLHKGTLPHEPLGKLFHAFSKTSQLLVKDGRQVEPGMWWPIPITPALGRLRQDDCKFEANLGY